jgi:hypothetical protein
MGFSSLLTMAGQVVEDNTQEETSPLIDRPTVDYKGYKL